MTEEQFRQQIESNVTPIFFFDQNQKPVLGGNKNTMHGTLTLYRKGHVIFGITNYHVYASWSQNKSKICQIGSDLRINLEERCMYKDEKNDLYVIFLNEMEMPKIGEKHGFTLLNYNIAEILHQYQKEDDPNTWACHVVGFFGKETTEIDSEVLKSLPTESIRGKRMFQENFDTCPYICHARFCPENNEITLNISKTKEAVDAGKICNIKEFPEHFSFGGMSGGPVFARIPHKNDPYSNAKQLSLVGIIHEGSEEPGMEVIKARPISLLRDVLEKATS